MIRFLQDELRRQSAFSSLKAALTHKGVCAVEGVCEGARAPLISALAEEKNETCVVLCADEREALGTTLSLRAFFDNTLFFPAREYSLTPSETRNEVFSSRRLQVFSRLLTKERAIVVTTAEACLQTTLPPKDLRAHFFELADGDTLSPEALSAQLTGLGYTFAERVEGVGQFSRRGGIVDFFSPAEENACRIEFFGDEIERITAFDTQTQKSVLKLERVLLLPAVALYFSPQDRAALLGTVEEALAKKRLSDEHRAFLTAQKEALTLSLSCAQDTLFGLVYEEATLFDYLPNAPVFVQDLARVEKSLAAAARAQSALFEAAAPTGAFSLFAPPTLPSFDTLFAELSLRRCAALSSLSVGLPTEEAVRFFTRPSPLFFENREVLLSTLGDLVGARCRVCYLASTPYAAQNLTAFLTEKGFSVTAARPDGAHPAEGEICVYSDEELLRKKKCVTGFECLQTKFCLLCEGTQNESAALKKSRVRSESKTKEALTSHAQLTVGDYVVHEAYGIAVFEGIETIAQNGAGRDFLKLRYAGGDFLYVPCSNLSQVSKYIGRGSDGTLALSRMGHARWNEHKRRAKSAARDIARELTALYAEREKSEGFAFSPDTPWQAEFEESFEYEETPGQLSAAEEVKRDMESRRPMDRLLCGDVGFGKTEVALRAVFKCVMDSRQAAILAPTTLLCNQHYRTVLSRFRGYPVKVAVLSRFSTKKQISQTLADLKSGACDVVIGTHRLLQKDVSFARLGLLVVDEEQRFGVKDKEALKVLSKNVDVLTLTATPIPRTLNMALSGVRDLSLLEEAPEDRLPVQTVVSPFDEALVLGAMKKELSRRGQIFYLVNDIARLPHRAAWIKAELPEARVRTAHGKLSREELWGLWQEMSDGEVDVLVCTTIVETGIDLPNANTLIVEHAERFGLSQLHQLRGRVGRSWRRAYAYFTYPAMRALPELAEKRLEAIRSFTRFGSGFSLAMRDLELRGAGSLLGAEQSGHMEKVGYDLYLRILHDAVLEEQGKTPEKTPDCYIDLPIRARLSESYVPSSADRIALYQRFSALLDEAAEKPLRAELADRFGPLTAEAENLFLVARLRREALALGFSKVSLTENVLSFFAPSFHEGLVALLSAVFGRYFYVSSGERPRMNLRLVERDAVEATEDFFFHCRAFCQDLGIQRADQD